MHLHAWLKYSAFTVLIPSDDAETLPKLLFALMVKKYVVIARRATGISYDERVESIWRNGAMSLLPDRVPTLICSETLLIG